MRTNIKRLLCDLEADIKKTKETSMSKKKRPSPIIER